MLVHCDSPLVQFSISMFSLTFRKLESFKLWFRQKFVSCNFCQNHGFEISKFKPNMLSYNLHFKELKYFYFYFNFDIVNLNIFMEIKSII